MEEQESVQNFYLDQVLQEQEAVDRELRRKVVAAPAVMGYRVTAADESGAPEDGKRDEAAGRAVDYRITGWGRWRTVVVPPNVYVVHTRRGRERPVHVGLGVSFRFNPATDAFLVIPAAVQTILINANCICVERQGILVQAYVQWIIDDIEMAYRKLDFSDPHDPMRIVNVQLGEQAEAAIKDKVATMSIDEVLSDKQPIIDELTHRLRAVGEGNREAGSAGLGLKIVTVQIKEAVVSSARVWQNLQVPFRAEREKLARLAQLESEQAITARELENRVAQETADLETRDRLAQLRAANEQAQYDRDRVERVRRHKLEQEAQREALVEENVTAQARREAELELALQELELEKRHIECDLAKVRLQMELDETRARQARAQVAAELEIKDLRDAANAAQGQRELALLEQRHAIENDLSERHLQAQLIARLPDIAEHLPAPAELHTTVISSDGPDGGLDPLLRFLAGALSLVDGALKRAPHGTTGPADS